MRIAFYPQEELKRNITSIVGRRLDPARYRVFFFGSRVAGGGSERSDIDVGIEGPEPIPFETMAQIRDEIEEIPTLYTIEVVDFKRVSDAFRTVALQRTESVS